MRFALIPAFVAGALASGFLTSPTDAAHPQEAPSPQEMAAMMKKVEKITSPGPHHKLLERFVGEWDTVTSVTMGGRSTPGEKGAATFAWLMEGRWLKGEAKGALMGRPMESFMILGYDNFKKSYVATYVNTMDTAMLASEGDTDRTGSALITYGTMDEYLTGEHDKAVKYVWRFSSKDKLVFEVHDLHIGESNTKVVETVYTRKS